MGVVDFGGMRCLTGGAEMWHLLCKRSTLNKSFGGTENTVVYRS